MVDASSGGAALLVTGGAGFIGSHLVERLLARGRRVVVLDNLDPFYDPEVKRRNIELVAERSGLERGSGFLWVNAKTFDTGLGMDAAPLVFVEGDLRDRILLDRLFSAFEIDIVFHGAARAGVRPSLADPVLYEEVNVRGTLFLLEAMRSRGVRRLVFASSSSVYGGGLRPPFREDDPTDRPFSPYAATKKACELLCANYHHLYGMQGTMLRFFTVYGPRQRPEMAIHKFTRLIDQEKPVPLFGDGTSRRDYTYIDDILQGVMAAIDRPFPFEVINLGESQTVTLKLLVDRISEALRKPARIESHPFQEGDVPLTHADISKAKRLLDYNPGIGIEEGIPRFVEWYRSRRIA
jgi:UDP-glucuronate 4-epimerase